MSAPPVLSTAGFSILQNEILLNPNISIEAKSALTLLKYFDRGNGRGCFARKETLCHFLSISPYRLRKALVELAELSLITITKRGQGNPDLIQVVPREEPEPLQVEVEEELQKELGHVAEEPLEESHIPEVNHVEIQTGEFLSAQHYKEENKEKKISNTLKQRDEVKELITYFFKTKEGRKPTKNELTNWRPTAKRLLEEFTLDELKPATDYAIDQGARLFYFLALTAPAFILEQRQQKQIELERKKHTEKTLTQDRQRQHQLEELKSSAAVYDAETSDLLSGLESRLRPQVFGTWFKDSFITKLTEDSLTLVTPSQGAADWIRGKYMALLEEVSGKAHIRLIAIS